MNKLRIGIDIRLITYRRGIGNYVFNFLNELALIDSFNEYILYTNDRYALEFIPKQKNFILKIIKSKLYPFWEQVLLPIRAKFDKLDLLHCPANAAPIWLPNQTKLILTIHDIMYMLPETALQSSPSLYQKLGRKYLKFIVPIVAKKSQRIITISNFSQSDILKYIKVNPDKLKVIYEAHGKSFKRMNQDESAKIISKFNIKGKYIVTLGALDPRKNTAGVIDAFCKLLSKKKVLIKLVIVGLPKNAQLHFEKQIQRLYLDNDVILLGFVSEEELVSLYNQSELMLYVSLYEGFGIPILEAMACGTPIVASNCASIPEIAGDAAILINPHDINEICNCITNLCTNQHLREEYIDLGFQHIEKFSWKNVATKTLEIYEEN